MSPFAVQPSALTYLFGDKLADLFAGKSLLSLSETLPCRGTKVKQNDLATAIITFSLVYLADSGELRLTTGKTGRLIKRTHVFADRAGAGQVSGGLEEQILGAFRPAHGDNDVPSVVWRLWRSDAASPVGDVIRWAKTYLQQMGYFVEEQRKGIGRLLGAKLVPDCSAILPLESEVGALRGIVQRFSQGEPEIFAQLWSDVSKGISSRQESQDVDMD
jgi:hypothetical protein